MSNELRAQNSDGKTGRRETFERGMAGDLSVSPEVSRSAAGAVVGGGHDLRACRTVALGGHSDGSICLYFREISEVSRSAEGAVVGGHDLRACRAVALGSHSDGSICLYFREPGGLTLRSEAPSPEDMAALRADDKGQWTIRTQSSELRAQTERLGDWETRDWEI